MADEGAADKGAADEGSPPATADPDPAGGQGGEGDGGGSHGGGAQPPAKAAGAFRTIGEVSRDTGVPPHVLRYWETRFPQLRPVTRAGQRRYYRPQDVALVVRIDRLLSAEGYTIRGVQQLLAAGTAPAPASAPAAPAAGSPLPGPTLLDAVRRVRDALAAALADD